MPNEPATAVQAATVQPLQRPAPNAQRSLVVKLAGRFNVDPEKLLTTLKATAFRQRPDRQGNVREPTNEEMMALLVIADQYSLNPFTKELFAFLDPKSGAVVPVVSVDGWIRIINDRPELRSVSFTSSPETIEHKGKTCHAWMECEIVRSDRDKPMVIREYFDEVARKVDFSTPWDSHPNRMHRHKVLIQCARVAFGFGGIYDEDEAGRIIDAEAQRVLMPETAPSIAAINATIAPPRPAPAIEHQPIDVVPVQVPQEPEPVAAEASPPRQAKSGKAKSSAPTFTYAEIADRLQKAGDADQLAEAMSLIDAIGDENLRVELQQLAEHRERTLMGEG